MSALSKWRESRRIVESAYEVPKIGTAGEAMLRHAMFVNTCMALDLSIVRTSGAAITVSGRARNVAAFQRRLGVLA